MARSQYIYGLLDNHNARYYAFFTVKHEAITTIKRSKLPAGSVTMMRWPDGRPAEPEVVNLAPWSD